MKRSAVFCLFFKFLFTQFLANRKLQAATEMTSVTGLAEERGGSTYIPDFKRVILIIIACHMRQLFNLDIWL